MLKRRIKKESLLLFLTMLEFMLCIQKVVSIWILMLK